MYLAEEDREGKEGATKISPGSTSSGVALVLAAAAATASFEQPRTFRSTQQLLPRYRQLLASVDRDQPG